MKIILRLDVEDRYAANAAHSAFMAWIKIPEGEPGYNLCAFSCEYPTPPKGLTMYTVICRRNKASVTISVHEAEEEHE